METSASGSIFRLSLDACQNMQEHWVDMGASLTRTQTLSNKDDQITTVSTRLTTLIHYISTQNILVLSGIWSEEKKNAGKKPKSDRNGRGNSEERSKRRLSYFTLCLWAPVWCSVCVCVCDQGSSLSFPGLFSCCQLKVSELECELRVPFAVVVYSVGLLLLISVLHVTTLWREWSKGFWVMV